MAGEEEWMEKHLDMEEEGETQWKPTQAVTQDTRTSHNSQETHLVRKWGDIGHQQAVGPENDICKEKLYFTTAHFWNLILIITEWLQYFDYYDSSFYFLGHYLQVEFFSSCLMSSGLEQKWSFLEEDTTYK